MGDVSSVFSLARTNSGFLLLLVECQLFFLRFILQFTCFTFSLRLPKANVLIQMMARFKENFLNSCQKRYCSIHVHVFRNSF